MYSRGSLSPETTETRTGSRNSVLFVVFFVLVCFTLPGSNSSSHLHLLAEEVIRARYGVIPEAPAAGRY